MQGKLTSTLVTSQARADRYTLGGVVLVTLLTKSLYFESYGENLLLGVGLMYFLLQLRGVITAVVPVRLYFFILGYFLLVIVNPMTQVSSVIVLVVRMLIAFAVIVLIPFRQFCSLFSRVIFFLGIASLLSPLVITLNIPSFLPAFSGIDGRPLRNFVLFGVSEGMIQNSVFRNSGLWWEPGAFQVFLNLAVLFDILTDRITPQRFLAWAVIILSVGSSTGNIVFALLGAVYLAQLFALSRHRILASIGWTLGSLVVIGGVLPGLIDKLNPDSVSVISFLSRFYDFQISWDLFVKNWGLGYGFGSQILVAIPAGVDLLGSEVYFSLAKPTGSDGITMLIAQCGLPMLVFIFPLLLPRYTRSRSCLVRLLLFIALFLVFDTENLSFHLLFMVLTFYGVTTEPPITASIHTKGARRKSALNEDYC